MLYFDYDWDLDPAGIKLDTELNLERLGWVPGNYFKLVFTDDGHRYLKKVDLLEQFLLQGATEKVEQSEKRE